MRGSRSPETSLIISAPASMAARATSARRVSIEINPDGLASLSPRITGTTRSISSSGKTGSAPGRVDSPPMSSHFAPFSHMAKPV